MTRHTSQSQKLLLLVLLLKSVEFDDDVVTETLHWRSEGCGGCGPHRAALARGGKRAKIVFKIHVKIQIV